jgi:hypothetical protein
VKPDDCSLDPDDYVKIRKHARLVLEGAGAFGRFPTPVADVMEYAKVIVAEKDALDAGFVDKLKRKATGALKRAISKVRGVLDVIGRIAYIDRTLYVVKQTFLKLHETAHAVLPHQRKLYALVEDCDKTIAPDVSEQFDREANVFAAEVLFQLDGFIDGVRDEPFGILVPVRASKKYGASIYASVRQYVCKHHRACCVLVINPPVLVEGHGFVAELRRAVTSPSFDEVFGQLRWPAQFTPSDDVGAMVPINGRKMSRPRDLNLVDANGVRHECVAEAFTQGQQVFVLIHAVATLTRTTVILSLNRRF